MTVPDDVTDLSFLHDDDPKLPPGGAEFTSSSSSSSYLDLASSDVKGEDEEISAGVDVEEVEKTKKKKPKVRLELPGSSLLTMKSLDDLREKCGIPVEIMLVVPDVAGETSVVQEEHVSKVAGPTTAETSLPEFLTGAEVDAEGVDPEETLDEDDA
ncbi:hypothetical protein AALP_AA4G091300 [Arabis alpina]|uniref:Uncharacterized protein n=1 Tax=Arabis alpina TaxID=50452 RepID=A0A087H250_ARAAL|nr:hypothetical protein AALP_AA4G091300 [Arabis alpina]